MTLKLNNKNHWLKLKLFLYFFRFYKGFPGSSPSKESTCNAGDPGSIPESGRSGGEGQATHSSIHGFPWQLKWYRICLQCKRPGFSPWVGKIPWRRAWQPTLVFLPGESPWTEEPGRLQSIASQSWTRLKQLSIAQQHIHQHLRKITFQISICHLRKPVGLEATMIKEGSTDLRRQRRQSLCRVCKLNTSNRFKLLVL